MVEENHLSNKISDWETNEKAHRVRFGRDSRAQQVVSRSTDGGTSARPPGHY
jgi:hypothetical protein